MITRVLVVFVIWGVASAGSGCCTAALEARTLQRRSQQQSEKRFLRVARRLAKEQGAIPVVLQRTQAWRSISFGVPTRVRSGAGPAQILVAAHLGRHPGLLVAKQGASRYLVIVAKPSSTRHRSLKSCACRSHGGAFREAPRPPVFILPVKDLSQVTVIGAPYHRRVISIRQNRCGGPPVP